MYAPRGNDRNATDPGQGVMTEADSSLRIERDGSAASKLGLAWPSDSAGVETANADREGKVKDPAKPLCGSPMRMHAESADSSQAAQTRALRPSFAENTRQATPPVRMIDPAVMQVRTK